MKRISRQKITRFIYLASIAYLLFLFILYYVESSIAERTWYGVILTYCPQIIFALPLFALIILCLIFRSWKSLVINAIGVFFILIVLMGFNVPKGAATDVKGNALRVLTFNIHHGSYGLDRVAELIKQADPDVVCLQEANDNMGWNSQLPELVRRLPGYNLKQYGELATFSKYPILETDIPWLSLKSGTHALTTKIQNKDSIINIINVHFSTAATPISLAHRNIPARQYLNHTVGLRYEQIISLKNIAALMRENVIICGDFNTPPQGLIYDQMRMSYDDVFAASNWGWGYTFKSSLPMLRIDYIYVRKGMGVKVVRIPQQKASDHKAVVADIICVKH